MRKRLILGASAGLAGFALLATSAQAHVSFHPNVLPAGANATLDIRVPNEMDNANTTKLAVQVPPGFIDIATQPIPGWSAQIKTRKLATPVQTDDGPVSEEVSEIIWTGSGADGRIPPDSFQNFAISTQIPDQSGHVLTFKVLQYYDNGQVVRWIGPESSDTPAPTIDVTDANGVIQDVAGSEAGPPAIDQLPSSSGSPSSSDSASKGLGIAALVVGALGLLAGGIALVRSGRRPAG